MSEDRKTENGYLDKLVDATPGSGQLMKSSGMDIDLAKLTIAGWLLSVLTILTAGTAVVAPAVMLATSEGRLSGGLVRAIGIPIAIVVGGGTFWLGKMLLGAANIPITRD